jgi:DNA-binding NarL/FixJ family response regulator
MRGDAVQAAPLVSVLDSDRAALELLGEWLSHAGFRVSDGRDAHVAAVLIVDVPFTRGGARDYLERVARDHPGKPILALSPTFFSNVRCRGGCARALGVAGVLPKPVSRETVIAAVREVLGRVE